MNQQKDLQSKFDEVTKKVDAILKIQDFILNELPVLKNLPDNVKGMFNTQFLNSSKDVGSSNLMPPNANFP